MKSLTRLIIFLLPIIYSFIFSCKLFDFSNIEIKIFPNSRNSILNKDEKIHFSFSEIPNKEDVENLISITCLDNSVLGHFYWEDNILFWEPYEELKIGIIHFLTFKGMINFKNRTIEVSKEIPFYYCNNDLPLSIIPVYPNTEIPIDINSSIEFASNYSLDKELFENEFKISPYNDLAFEWNENFNHVKIMSKTKWTNNTLYTWTISNKIKSQNNHTMIDNSTGIFLVQKDKTFPIVESVCPAIIKNQNFTTLQLMSLDKLQNDMAIFVKFNTEIEYESLLNSFSITPLISGYFTNINNKEFIYHITNELSLQEYKLNIKKGLKSKNGNFTIQDHIINFTPDLNQFKVDSIEIQNNNFDNKIIYSEDFNKNTPIENSFISYFGDLEFYLPIKININKKNSFSVLSQNERVSFVNNISCNVVFPFDIPNPELTITNWSNNNTINLILSNIAKSTEERKIFYKLLIKKGNSSSCCDAGSFLENDIYLYFEAPNE